MLEIIRQIKISNNKYIILLRNKTNFDTVYFMYYDSDYMMLRANLGVLYKDLNNFSDEDIIKFCIEDDTIKDYYKMIELHEDYIEEVLNDVQ